LDWDYKNRFVDLFMPGCIKAALRKFQHPSPTRPENSPHTWSPPVYGARKHYVEEHQDSPLLTQKDVARIKQLAGTLLYYARAVDPTLILPLNVLVSEQNQDTSATADKVIKLFN
jgi:hypothetical protein